MPRPSFESRTRYQLRVLIESCRTTKLLNSQAGNISVGRLTLHTTQKSRPTRRWQQASLMATKRGSKLLY